MVRKRGLEPPCLAAPDPKSGASANFAISAWCILANVGRDYSTKIFILQDENDFASEFFG